MLTTLISTAYYEISSVFLIVLDGVDELPDTLLRHDDDDDDEYVCKQNATKISREEGAASSSAPFSHRRATSALVVSRPSHDAELPRKPFKYHLNSITPRDINFSIISSENTRVVCSFVIAVLVVLSQINLPHKVIKSKSLIDYRPLYAVLLSDLLIVSATLALCSQGEEDEREMKLEGDVNWEGAVKLLEWGLILHQTIRAIFIDCSLYLAIVICSLSLMHWFLHFLKIHLSSQ